MTRNKEKEKTYPLEKFCVTIVNYLFVVNVVVVVVDVVVVVAALRYKHASTSQHVNSETSSHMCEATSENNNNKKKENSEIVSYKNICFAFCLAFVCYATSCVLTHEEMCFS